MTVLLLALASAFFVGLSNVLIRKGLDLGTKMQAIFLSLVTSTIIFWILAILFGDLHLLLVPAAVLFVVAGLLGGGMGRMLNITSIERIGVARTLPITGVAPFFATIVAILFLGEEYSFYLFFGAVLILFGIYVISRRASNGAVFDKKDLLLPLTAAMFGGFSIAITRKALLVLGDPFIGLAIAGTAALILALVYILASGQIRYVRPAVSAGKIFILAGLAGSAAFFLNFSALKIGDVSMVAPVFSTFPLFAVLLSHLFLKEEITARIWLGAVIIILGIAVIQVF